MTGLPETAPAERRNWIVLGLQNGTLLIFERCGFEEVEAGREAPLPYGSLPLALFFRSYRERDAYAAPLAQTGFRDVRIETFELDLPFVLVTARK